MQQIFVLYVLYCFVLLYCCIVLVLMEHHLVYNIELEIYLTDVQNLIHLIMMNMAVIKLIGSLFSHYHLILLIGMAFLNKAAGVMKIFHS